MGFPIDLPSGKGMTINYLLCIIALSCFFSGASVARWWRLECKRLFCLFAKSVKEKNNRRVDCAEDCKKTVQAMHFDRLSGRQAE